MGIKGSVEEPGGLLSAKSDVRRLEQRPLGWDIVIRGH
jgi:hypothetical protein